VLSLAVVAGTLWPNNRTAYQAGPLSPPHAPFNANCGVCHTESFVTASRFLPANRDVRAAPDAACVVCHPAGAHSPHQLKYIGADGQAAACAECHHEHHGVVSLTRIDDAYCTTCHANLPTDDDGHRFTGSIRSFD